MCRTLPGTLIGKAVQRNRRSALRKLTGVQLADLPELHVPEAVAAASVDGNEAVLEFFRAAPGVAATGSDADAAR